MSVRTPPLSTAVPTSPAQFGREDAAVEIVHLVGDAVGGAEDVAVDLEAVDGAAEDRVVREGRRREAGGGGDGDGCQPGGTDSSHDPSRGPTRMKRL
jgi:hypothetical protein